MITRKYLILRKYVYSIDLMNINGNDQIGKRFCLLLSYNSSKKPLNIFRRDLIALLTGPLSEYLYRHHPIIEFDR